MDAAMRIHLYTICWNERTLLPYFLRHYEQFCEAIIVYDNGSNDESTEIVAAHRLCELRHVDSRGEYDESVLMQIKGNAWKESRGIADWVISCDVDELLYHPDMMGFLSECRESGVTVPIPSGFQMVATMLPQNTGQIYDGIRNGFPDPAYSKRVIFNPTAIREINYGPGCHHARPEGDVRQLADPALKLLHFKFLGLDYLTARYAEMHQRQSKYNREREFGIQYSWDPQRIADAFAWYEQQAVPIDLNA